MTRNTSAETQRLIAKFQRLSCLNGPRQAILPSLLSILREAVPHSSTHVFLSNARLEVEDAYFEGRSTEHLHLYFNEFYRAKEKDVTHSFSEGMRRAFAKPVSDLYEFPIKVDRRDYARSVTYNELMRPVGLENGICVLATDGRTPVGSLMLFRGADEPAFSPRHFTLLHALRGHFGHALGGTADLREFSDTDDQGLIVTDHQAKILHMSANAQRLLLMATVPRWTPEAAARLGLDPPDDLARLCALLRAAWSNGGAPAPPALSRRNDWGEFRLRAYWLDAVHPDETSRFVGITIQRREWRPLALYRKVEALALTDREKQVCLLLLQGRTTAEIVQTMCVSENTVISHRRHVYTKLGVANRTELSVRIRVE